MLDELRRRGWSVMGTEASEMAARHARDVLGLPVATQDVQELRLGEGSLDVVTLYHVLEHLPDARGCLQEVHRALKPGGIVVVAVPNLDSLEARWTGRGWFHLDPPRHQFHFSKRALLRMLRELGFEPVRVKRFSLEYGPYGMLQSLLNRMGFPQDFLYNALKKPEARLRNGTPRGRRVLAGIANVLALPLLAPVSFALHTIDALLGGGSCIEVQAVRGS
jgi:SAM-dependent methyltransferase